MSFIHVCGLPLARNASGILNVKVSVELSYELLQTWLQHLNLLLQICGYIIVPSCILFANILCFELDQKFIWVLSNMISLALYATVLGPCFTCIKVKQAV
ncbi:hypothetical protein CEXT_603311 [Caerostris extrusa]|uniref:Uncharacterized protein n=1 Tax=Caerostris extrusa TaxID=172846 RepID=A0AAV4XPZ5_CAEEX|nr:hypothetical protein CEXT_603311 [Caerostris extrusa]